MAASLNFSQRKGNDNMSRTKSHTRGVTARRHKPVPITAQDALDMLASAVSYCQQAGLKVGAANGDNGTLGLFIPNAHYLLTDDGTRAAFRLGAFSQSVVRDDVHDVSAQSIGTAKG
jgi:hypothetical protein